MRAFAHGQIDVLIGTQVMAKGHHFPQLTLVGVIDADLGGSDGDVRARERTFQLLHQVSGRAGRAEKPGIVLLQTRNPDDAVMQALVQGARDDFYEQERRFREAAGAPPFGRLAAVIVSGPDGDKVREIARQLGRAAPAALVQAQNSGIPLSQSGPSAYGDALRLHLAGAGLLPCAQPDKARSLDLLHWLRRAKG